MDDFITIPAHTSHVTDVRFTDDSSRLISSGMDNMLKIWNVATWEVEVECEAHEKSVNDFALTPDGKTLMTVSTDRTMRVWSFPDMTLKHTVKGHKNTIAAVRISPDGKYVATASNDTTVRIWDTNTWDCIQTLKGHRRNVTSLCFVKKDLLASSGLGDNVYLWRVPTGELVKTLEGHKAAVTIAGITPGGEHLVTAGYEGQIKMWDTDNWAVRASFEPGSSGLLCLDISPHGTMLAIGGERNVSVWSLEMLDSLVDLPIKPKGVYGIAFSNDGEWLACAAADKQIRLWQVDSVI